MTQPFVIQWTLEDSQAAQAQGWDLFDATNRFEIEVCTESPGHFEEGADDDAVAWIIQQACQGNAVCAKGLLMAGLLDPEWFAADLTHAVKTGRVDLRDTRGVPSKPRSSVKHRSS